MTPEQIRNAPDDNAPSTPQEPRGAILPAVEPARGYSDADLLRRRTEALNRPQESRDKWQAEAERLRRREARLVEQLQDEVERATRRADAAEAKLRDVEALRDKWLAVDVPSAEVTSWSHYAGAALRAVLARSQAPQAPAEQEPCLVRSDDDAICWAHGGEWVYEDDGVTVKPRCEVADQYDDPAPSVRPDTAGDEGVRRG